MTAAGKLRLYIDEDAMDGEVNRGLRSRGIDVLTAVDAGMIGRPDEDHLAFATAEGRTLYSFSVRDFHQSRAAETIAESF